MNTFLVLKTIKSQKQMNLDLTIIAQIITAFAAVAAVLMYFKQKRDRVSEASAVVLLEIRQAEKAITIFKESGIVNTINGQLLIPTNNWKSYAHLFVRRFDFDELELISRFYLHCQAIDRCIIQMSTVEQVRDKTTAFQNSLCSLALDYRSKPDLYPKERDAFINLINPENTVLIPVIPREHISKHLNAIESVTTTSAGVKLKKLANRRW